MEKRVLYGLVVMLMYLVHSGFSQGEVKNEEAEWERFLIEAKQPILVTLTSSLCGVPCAILEDQVAQLAKTYGNRIIVYKADILEKPFLARLYKVLSVPTLIVLKGGKEIKRLEKNIYWGEIYDLIESSTFGLAMSPSDSALSPSDSAPPSFESGPLFESLLEVESWKNTLDEAQHPIVAMVTSSLCGPPCAILEDQMAQLAKTYLNQIIFYKNDILEKPFFAKLYKVFKVPTVLVFKDGELIIRYENLSDWSEINDLIFDSSMFGSALPPSGSTPPPFGE